MKQKSLSGCIVLALLQGCTSPASVSAFGDVVVSIDTSLKARSSLAEQIQSSDTLTRDSRNFLAERPNLKVLKISNKAECSTSIAHEVDVAKARKEMFKIVDTYFKSIKDMLGTSRSTEITETATGLASSASALAAQVGAGRTAALLGSASTIATAVGKLAATVETEAKLKRIQEMARKIHPQIVDIVNDINAGLYSSDARIDAEVKLWETCEYERLLIIFADPATSKADMSGLYATYRDTLYAYRQKLGALVDTGDTLQELIATNAAIANPAISPKSIADAATRAEAIIAQFKAAQAALKGKAA